MTTINTRKNIWITGASSGIGRALALILAQQGNCVLASGRNLQALGALAGEHKNIKILAIDISEAIDSDAIRQHFEFLNCVILNAGTCEYLDVDAPDWSMMERVMRVNFLGAVNSLEAALPLLRSNPLGGGHIVGVGSLATVVPFARAEAYGASKAALQYWLNSLRLDFAPEGIDVTVVNPGFVKTPLTDKNDFEMPFLMSAQQAAQRISCAIESRPRVLNFPRRLSYLLHFMRLFPSLWQRLMVAAKK